jgi:UDP-N-acetylglucosamine 1-carboxyvinyltransferase
VAKFIINGSKSLNGDISVSGSKNHALKVFAASILFSGPVKIGNVPLIEDILRMSDLLSGLGVKVRKTGPNLFDIDPCGLNKADLDPEIASRFRSSVVLIGPILARLGRVSIPHPGGCLIGQRPIDFFIQGLSGMGANFDSRSGRYFFEAKKLAGIDFTFRVPSVTATETLMMAAIFAEGKTILRNAACEPEIEALAEFLNESGAVIRGAGTHTVYIDGLGRQALLKQKKPCRAIPDRIEAGSFLILGALAADSAAGGIKIKNCNPQHLASLISHLECAGVSIKKGKNWMEVSRPKSYMPVNVKTREYPGFATDLQAPFTVFLTQADGESLVFETIFDGRLEYINDLNRMGAKITLCDPHRAIVIGPTQLHGREMESPDLRAGLAFVIAALIAKGRSVIHNVYQIDRGCERVDEKLQKIGADIKRIS